MVRGQFSGRQFSSGTVVRGGGGNFARGKLSGGGATVRGVIFLGAIVLEPTLITSQIGLII